MDLRTGVDLVEIERVKQAIKRHEHRFVARVLTPREREEVGSSYVSLAARWAGKEAVAKAFCTGIGDMSFQEIEILRGARGEPTLHLHGAAATMAEEQNLTAWSISLSHTKTHAIAMVVAIGRGDVVK